MARLTPGPQGTVVATPQARPKRATRSASRDIAELPIKPLRRSTRQASVTSIASEGGNDDLPKHGVSFSMKDSVAELTMVEEMDSEVDFANVPQSTPRRPRKMEPLAHRSPEGSADEISGTTVIASLSQTEAQDLDSDDIKDSLDDLFKRSTKFLEFLVPKHAGLDNERKLEEDLKFLEEFREPSLEFRNRFQRLEKKLKMVLSDFKTERQPYILPRAIRRKMAPDQDPSKAQPGLDLVVYLANLVAFIKQLIICESRDKASDVLRELDNTFPQYFLSGVKHDGPDLVNGETALTKETFSLALELRTHLAITRLEAASTHDDSDPDATIDDIFYRLDHDDSTGMRGWNVPGLKEGGLSSSQESALEERAELCSKMDFSTFPWDSLIVELLGWVRLRRGELLESVRASGGIEGLLKLANGQASVRQVASRPEIKSVDGCSFTSENRRGSGKFDAARARFMNRVAHPPPQGPEAEPGKTSHVEPTNESQKAATGRPREEALEGGLEPALPAHDDDDFGQGLEDAVGVPSTEAALPVVNDDESGQGPEDPLTGASNKLPETIAEFVNFHKNAKKADKENRGDFFARQANARRIEFGTGFDDSQQNEPRRASPRKRRRAEKEDSSDEDEFETVRRDKVAEARRGKAPVAKRVRIDDSGPSRPRPSARRDRQRDNSAEADETAASTSEVRRMSRDRPSSRRERQQRDASSEADGPPPSSFEATRSLMRQNVRAVTTARDRKRRVNWTAEEEEAVLEYMSEFPQKYSAMLEHDSVDGGNRLQGRDQVQIKDKVRNMALAMIKIRNRAAAWVRGCHQAGVEDGDGTAESGIHLVKGGFMFNSLGAHFFILDTQS
ncbi:hypothetical protein M011DRAFT_466967 [Sporormia fimetaria CBS 119925]|uniref:Myb-like domain-containing protein n=1 Tax=Sporormia fimetaria CBS 119925 TaxID=1340428 RepID=A0A6A6VFQ4_9PLEO|nr:hypothetical protein M011DRAFT_466967 [Sporormia fimetaria CBS 119925]